jgi:hypothetical protein
LRPALRRRALSPGSDVTRYERSDVPDFRIDVSATMHLTQRGDELMVHINQQFDDELERRRRQSRHQFENIRTGERFNIDTSWIQTDDDS